jgi:hypothetical protein
MPVSPEQNVAASALNTHSLHKEESMAFIEMHRSVDRTHGRATGKPVSFSLFTVPPTRL